MWITDLNLENWRTLINPTLQKQHHQGMFSDELVGIFERNLSVKVTEVVHRLWIRPPQEHWFFVSFDIRMVRKVIFVVKLYGTDNPKVIG